jgi:hypothetical protein
VGCSVLRDAEDAVAGNYCEPLALLAVNGRAVRPTVVKGSGFGMRALRRLPIMKVLAIAEVAMLARKHISKLDPEERGRLFALVRRGRHMTGPEREELSKLVAKLEPRRFAGLVADKFSPIPLPRRIVNGPRRR